jgi:hypothetical protein
MENTLATIRALRDWERHEAVRGAIIAYFSGIPVGPDGRWKPVDCTAWEKHPLWTAIIEWWTLERARLMEILG